MVATEKYRISGRRSLCYVALLSSDLGVKPFSQLGSQNGMHMQDNMCMRSYRDPTQMFLFQTGIVCFFGCQRVTPL